MRCVLLVLLTLVALASCQIQLNSFEGVYTSHQFGKGTTWVCQDDNLVQGSYDEVGIFHCLIGDDGVCKGEYFDAGAGPCVQGTIQISVTSGGFSGFYTCNQLDGEFAWTEKKLSGFRPTNEQCRLLFNEDLSDDDDEDDVDIQGRHYLSGNIAQPEDICFSGDNKNSQSSYEYFQGSELIEGYTTGLTGYNGKVVSGTWFENFSAGPILYFLRDTKDIEVFWWTGLEGSRGFSVVNPEDYNSPDRHNIDTLTGQELTTNDHCGRYSILRPYVLENLHAADDNGDFFYFVGDDFNPKYGFPYYPVERESSTATSLLVASSVTLAAFLALFL